MSEKDYSPNGDHEKTETNADDQQRASHDFSADDDANFGDYGGDANEQQYDEREEFEQLDDADDTDTKGSYGDHKKTAHQSSEITPTGRDYTTSEYYKQMLSYGVAEPVVGELIEMVDAGILKHDEVEERLFESVKTVRPDQCAYVLRKFREANLMGINNIPAYLGSLLKNFKERLRTVGEQTALAQPIMNAPPAEKIKPILDRTGYSLEVTIGQRKYGGPPPDWGDAPIPGAGHEVYVGKLPKDVLEDELILLFEECGKIYDLRLMMDPISGHSKGYAFVTYVNKESATAATKKYEGYEIRKGKRLRVNVSIANTRLFIGNIPKSKGKDEINEEFTKNAELEGITDVIIYANPDDPDRKKNRGFCFLEFIDHRAASQAKRRLAAGRIRPWNGDVVVDWAEPQDEPDEETMSQVKVVYVKPLKEAVTEDELKDIFKEYGEIDRVKKIKDYAFVHYMDRESAMKAIEAMNGKDLHGDILSCSLARPQVEKKKRDSGRNSSGPGTGSFGRNRESPWLSGRGGSGQGAWRGGFSGGSGYSGRRGYGGGGNDYDYYGGGGGGGGGGGNRYGDFGYGGDRGTGWYGQQQGYYGYYGDSFGSSYGGGRQSQGFRSGRGGGGGDDGGGMSRGSSRGRGGGPARGRGGSSGRGGGFRGGMSDRGGGGFSPRGGGGYSGGGGRGFRGGGSMKRKGGDYDNSGAKRRATGGGRGGGRGGWNSRGGGWGSSENFAEDDY